MLDVGLMFPCLCWEFAWVILEGFCGDLWFWCGCWFGLLNWGVDCGWF